MEQSGERRITLPRAVILGWMLVPLLPGFAALMNAIDAAGDPRFHGVRGTDFIRLGTIGFAAGIVFAGLMLFIHSKERRS